MSYRADLENELKELVTGALSEELQEVISQNSLQSDGQLLLSLCYIFKNKVEIQKTERMAWGNKYTHYSYTKKNSNIEDQELMVYGAKLIYSIRKFLNDGQEIFFHFASKDEHGRYLSDAVVSQKEVFQALTQVSKKGIGVTEAIQRQLIDSNKETVVNTNFVNRWKRVEYLSYASYRPGRNINKEVVAKSKKDGRAIYAYQSQKKDDQVYLRFIGKNNYVKYYKIGNDLSQFNNGWLWQWYDSIYNSGDVEKNQEVEQGLQKGTLLPIFQEKDYIPGTKQGDYRDIQGRQIQNKYGATKIISYNNILKIMNEFTILLEVFLGSSTDKEAKDKLLLFLQENFIPDTVYKESENIDKTLDDLLKKFTEKSI